MIHAYHVIFGTYGFRLPNDPRGSWSEFVGSWELFRFGKSTYGQLKKELSRIEEEKLMAMRESLLFPRVQWTGIQARSVATGFAKAKFKSNLTYWACSILEEHVHAVVARHTYRVEQIVGLMKGEATKQLIRDSLHPLVGFKTSKGTTPSPWNYSCWKCYLNSEAAIEEAIAYVNENPVKEGKAVQPWKCVTPFRGLDAGWITYHS